MKNEFGEGLLQALRSVRRWTSVVASRATGSVTDGKRGATVALLIGALAGTGPSVDAQNLSLPFCPDPGMCFVSQAAKDTWAAARGCSFQSGDDGKEVCSEGWRASEAFLGVSEGALKTDGYVPTYSKDVKDKDGNIIHKKGEAIGSSGVTISTGIDLGQQSASGTRRIIDDYIKEMGDASGVDVDALLKKLDPYFGLRKQLAIHALVASPLSVSIEEALILQKAFSHDTQSRVAKQFDKNNTKEMIFQQLPEEAQTVIVDFSYQYGLSTTKGTVRTKFWAYAHDGDWQGLADYLKSNPDAYSSRRKREGDLLQQGIDNKNLPTTGNPCTSATP